MRELADKDANVAIVWRAFELRPDPVPTLDPNGDYLHRVWGSSVYPLAEHLGVDIKLPPVQPRSRRAHQAAHWARRHGKFREYNAALFRGFFQRGEDIGNSDVLARLASDMALDGDDPALFEALLCALLDEARRRRLAYVVAGFADGHPFLAAIKRRCRAREYASLLHVVHGSAGADAVARLDGRRPHVEVALL